MTVEPVPAADLQEQQEPKSPDDPPMHVSRPEEPEADVLEQELPVDGEDEEDDDERRHTIGEPGWRDRYPE